MTAAARARPTARAAPHREELGAPHAASPAALARALDSDLVGGLTGPEAAARLARVGANRATPPASPPYLRLAARQLADPLVALLVGAAAVSAAVGEGLEAAVIAAIVAVNALLGFAEESAAERAVIALRESFPEDATVVRDGREREIAAADVVPGDVLVLREGARVPADARVVETASLEVDESALTGESLPVDKTAAAVAAETGLADRRSLVYTGSAVTRGRARALVTATGPRSELGRIAALTAAAKPPPTPLQERLSRLALGMVGLGLAVTVLLGAAMLARGASAHEAFLTGVSVAVAAVPEGLAAIVTVALALGARAMAARGAIVRRLAAIETIGQTTLVCTDKTGTLTQNRLTVASVHPAAGVEVASVLEAAVLASVAELVDEGDGVRTIGDPVERAILLAAAEAGLPLRELRARPTPVELPFTSERRRLTVVTLTGGRATAWTKGAPETVLALCVGGPGREGLHAAVEALSAQGFRVLAVARRPLARVPAPAEDIEHDLEPLGLIALHDPLRPRAADAIVEARAAGVAVRMLTGDHPATAQAIGRAIGLADHEIHARVTPADKLAIVLRAQADGELVLVTGDGVNDAPALRAADVGAAMGRGGTEPAREAADIVLADDEFATVVAGIAEGRRVAANVRKVVAFLLSANFGEVLLFAACISLGLGVPMTVVQILLVNVLTDGLPALALARDAGDPAAMRRPPAPRAALFSRGLARALVLAGIVVGAAGLAAYLAGGGRDGDAAQTMAFATIALAELALVYALRSTETAAWRGPANRALTVAVAASALVVAAIVYIPALRAVADTTALSAGQLAAVVGLALAPAAAVEAAKAVRSSRRTVPAPPR